MNATRKATAPAAMTIAPVHPTWTPFNRLCWTLALVVGSLHGTLRGVAAVIHHYEKDPMQYELKESFWRDCAEKDKADRLSATSTIEAAADEQFRALMHPSDKDIVNVTFCLVLPQDLPLGIGYQDGDAFVRVETVENGIPKLRGYHLTMKWRNGFWNTKRVEPMKLDQ